MTVPDPLPIGTRVRVLAGHVMVGAVGTVRDRTVGTSQYQVEIVGRETAGYRWQFWASGSQLESIEQETQES